MASLFKYWIKCNSLLFDFWLFFFSNVIFHFGFQKIKNKIHLSKCSTKCSYCILISGYPNRIDEIGKHLIHLILIMLFYQSIFLSSTLCSTISIHPTGIVWLLFIHFSACTFSQKYYVRIEFHNNKILLLSNVMIMLNNFNNKMSVPLDVEKNK